MKIDQKHGKINILSLIADDISVTNDHKLYRDSIDKQVLSFKSNSGKVYYRGVLSRAKRQGLAKTLTGLFMLLNAARNTGQDKVKLQDARGMQALHYNLTRLKADHSPLILSLSPSPPSLPIDSCSHPTSYEHV